MDVFILYREKLDSNFDTDKIDTWFSDCRAQPKFILLWQYVILFQFFAPPVCVFVCVNFKLCTVLST